MDTGHLVHEMLVRYGVRYVFGIPGNQTQPLYDAIAESESGPIQHVLVRDERSGPYAADAYARVAGGLAVCDAVPGPGAIKLVSGLYEAQATSIPLIAVVGDIDQAHHRWKPFAAAAQGLDHVAMLGPVSKAVLMVRDAAEVADAVRTAFRLATTGRCGPVVVNIPDDVFHATWDAAETPAHVDRCFGVFPAQRPHPSEANIAAAVELLGRSDRPVMIVGGGGLISSAYEEVQAAAEAWSMAVVTTVTGKGAIAEDHRLSAGVLGGQYGEESANEIVRAADLVMLVGCKSSQQTTFGWTLPRVDQQVIQIDIDPYEVGKTFRADVGCVADAKAALRAMVSRGHKEAAEVKTAWLTQVQEAKTRWHAEIAPEMQPRDPIMPQYLVSRLQARAGKGDIFVSDASFSIGYLASYLDTCVAGRQCLFPRGSASLGTALPMAIGARLASEDRRVICLAGDGGIAYSMSELSTLRKYKLDVCVIVLNNGVLGYSRWDQRVARGNYTETEFPATDFASIAQGWGCDAYRVSSADELDDVLSVALSATGPRLVDVATDPWATPELSLRKGGVGVAG